MIESGDAKLVVGGTMVGGRSTGPGEVRGTSIEGGSVRNLAKGDVLHIPANVPHQVILDPGQRFSYLVVKVDDR